MKADLRIPVQVNVDQGMVQNVVDRALTRQRWRLVAAALTGLLAGLFLAACDVGTVCTGGSVCQSNKLSGPSAAATPAPSQQATPTPSPSPSASPAEDALCPITSMTLLPRDGITVSALVGGKCPAGETCEGRLSLTPYHNGVEVPERCNLPRTPFIHWISSNPSVEVGPGFEPIVTRKGVGTALVYAEIEGHVSNSVAVR